MIKRLLPVLLMLSLLAAGACAAKGTGKGRTTLDENGNVIYMDAPAEEEEDGQLLEESISSRDMMNITLSAQEKAALESPYTPMFDLDDQDREEVEVHFVFFTHKIRDRFEKWLERSQYYLPYMKQVFSERGLPEELIYLPFVESGYNPKVTSRAGARGMWQFMPSTGRLYGLQNDWWVDERRDPYKSAQAAADYLTKLYGMFGDWYLAVAAYNAGEGKIQRALAASGCDDFFDLSKKNDTLCGSRTKLKLETQHYVPRFLAVLKIVRNLEELGFQPLKWDKAPDLVQMDIPGGTDLKALAQSSGMGWEEFYAFNMAFRRYVSPPGRTSTVYIPRKYQAAAEQYLKDPTKTPAMGYSMYAVKSGDTIAKISKRTGIPADALIGVNSGVTLKGKLNAGQSLRLPSGSLVAEERVSSGRNSRSGKASASKRPNYKIKKGDTIYSLAKRYNISQDKLISLNGLSRKKNILKVGDKLYIPTLADAGKSSKSNKKTSTQASRNNKKGAAPAKKSQASSGKKSNSSNKSNVASNNKKSSNNKSVAQSSKGKKSNGKSNKNTASKSSGKAKNSWTIAKE